MRNVFWLLVLITLASSEMARAQATADHGNIAAIADEVGRCERLVVAGKDYSSKCQSRVANIAYKDGNSSFMFLAGDVAIFSFYGADSAAVSGHAVIRVKKVTFTLLEMGTAPNVMPATGQCTYTDPFAGVATIRCTAVSAGKRYAASFRSNGKAPLIKQF